MNLTQLRYFVAIADSGLNVSLAARRVYATQSGVSKQLKQLEQELGYELFSRRGRRLQAITPAGLLVLEHARKVVDEIAALRSLVAGSRDGAGCRPDPELDSPYEEIS